MEIMWAATRLALGRRPGQPWVLADLFLLRLPLGLADQLGDHEQVEQLQAVVDGPGLQVIKVASSVASRREGGRR
jgi:hypothetical protein